MAERSAEGALDDERGRTGADHHVQPLVDADERRQQQEPGRDEWRRAARSAASSCRPARTARAPAASRRARVRRIGGLIDVTSPPASSASSSLELAAQAAADLLAELEDASRRRSRSAAKLPCLRRGRRGRPAAARRGAWRRSAARRRCASCSSCDRRASLAQAVEQLDPHRLRRARGTCARSARRASSGSGCGTEAMPAQ